MLLFSCRHMSYISPICPMAVPGRAGPAIDPAEGRGAGRLGMEGAGTDGTLHLQVISRGAGGEMPH